MSANLDIIASQFTLSCNSSFQLSQGVNSILSPSHQLNFAIAACKHSQLPTIVHKHPVLLSGQSTYDTKPCASLGHLACQHNTQAVVWQFDWPDILAIWCF